MKNELKVQKFNKIMALILTVVVLSSIAAGLDIGLLKESSKVSAANKDEPVISTMSKYKNTDYSFLKTFGFGRKNDYSAKAVITTATVEALKNCTDVRLKAGKYVVTEGYSKVGDLGGATYLISSTDGGKGSIALNNGLYANIVPDIMTDKEGTRWMVVSVKQFGALGDSVNDDTEGLNDALNYATNKRVDNGCDRTILYIPSGEYKACNQLYAYEQYVNLVGDGDESVIFTDNDYKAESSYSEPFMECQGSMYAFYGHFKLEAREVDLTKYMRQMMMYYCTDVYIYDITYYIPQEAWSGNYYQDKQYTNLTVYAGNRQITVDDCLMYQMSGTYRGANMGIMDFYCTGTEDITVMNCEFHDNARDEQFGIFSVTDKPASYVKNVDFINNTVYTYSTPYKDVHGHRTMCFTVAYNGNNVSDINISGNHFISEADSKFMTFGSVKDCRITDNTFEIKASYSVGGAIFDSSNGNDENIVIDNNEFFLTYTYENAGYLKQLSTGHLTFTNNRLLSDINMWKMIEKNAVYENNEFVFLRQINNIGAPSVFDNNQFDTYGGHSGNDNGIFGNWSGNIDELSYCGNTINDYAYFGDAKSKRPFDRLFTLVGMSAENPFKAKAVYFNNNAYNAPNYGYKDTSDTMMICWLRNSYYIDKFECKGNVLQGAKGGWFNTAEYDISDNQLVEFSDIDYSKELISSVEITKDGKEEKEITVFDDSVNLSAIVKTADERDAEGNVTSEKEVNDRELKWLSSIEKNATVENGIVTRHSYGDVCIFAAATDGSGKYGKITIHFVEAEAQAIVMEKNVVKMYPNHVHDIMYQVMPYPYASQILEWTTSDSNVAEVTSDGIVTSKAVGEADITCKTTDGTNISNIVHIVVSEPIVVKVNIDKTYDVFNYNQIGETIQLNVTGYLPENAVNKGVGAYESSNESVAVVDSTGKVTLVGEGTANIRVYSIDRSCYANYNVYVKPSAIKNLKAVPSKDKAVVTWDKMPEASGYNLYRKKEGDAEWTCVAYRTPIKNTTYYDGYNGGLLESDTVYYYYAAAYVTGYDTGMRVDYEGIPTEVVKIKTNATEIPTGISSAVTNLSVVVNKSATLYVRVNPTAAEYQKLNWNVEDAVLAHVESESKSAASFAGDKVGFTNIIISEDVSGVEATVPLGIVPAYQVTQLEAENDYNNISLKWKGILEEENIDGYVITNGFTDTFVSLSDLRKSTYSDGESCYEYLMSGLTFGKTYSYTITPYIEHEGYKYICLKSASVGSTLPQYVAVTSITAQDEYIIKPGQRTNIVVNSEPANATRPEFLWNLKDNSIAGIVTNTKNSADIIGKTTGITQLEIIANDEDCYYVAPRIVVLPNDLSGLIANVSNYKNVQLSWNELSGVTGYNIYRQKGQNGEWEKIASTPNKVYVDSALEYSTAYNYRVCGYIQYEDKIYEGAVASNSAVTLESPYGKLISIGKIQDIDGIAHGTELSVESMQLPTTVDIVTTNSRYTTASIAWNLKVLANGTVYDKDKLEKQTFTLTGVVVIPEQIDANGVSTSVTVNVTVNAASTEEVTSTEETEASTETVTSTEESAASTETVTSTEESAASTETVTSIDETIALDEKTTTSINLIDNDEKDMDSTVPSESTSMSNKKPPKTGDNSSIRLLIGLMLMGVLLVGSIKLYDIAKR